MTETESPWNSPTPLDLKATIKFGKGYDDPWLTIGGGTTAQLRQALVESADLDPEAVKDHSLNQLVALVARDAQSQWAVAHKLGGSIISIGSAAQEPSKAPGSAQKSAPAPVATPGKDEATGGVFAELEECKTKEDIQNLYVRYVDQFKADEKVRDAFAARSKNL